MEWAANAPADESRSVPPGGRAGADGRMSDFRVGFRVALE